MKGIRTIALGLALIAGATTAQAQDQGQAQQQSRGQGRGMAALFEGITLSAEQQTKVDSIQKAFQPKQQAARDEVMAATQNGGDVAAARKKAMDLNAEMTAAVKAVLTTEQQATFDKNVEARRQQRQVRGNP